MTWYTLVTLVSCLSSWTLRLTRSGHMITGHSSRTGAFIITARAKEAWFTLCEEQLILIRSYTVPPTTTIHLNKGVHFQIACFPLQMQIKKLFWICLFFVCCFFPLFYFYELLSYDVLISISSLRPRIDPYDWFCGPGSNIIIIWLYYIRLF